MFSRKLVIHIYNTSEIDTLKGNCRFESFDTRKCALIPRPVEVIIYPQKVRYLYFFPSSGCSGLVYIEITLDSEELPLSIQGVDTPLSCYYLWRWTGLKLFLRFRLIDTAGYHEYKYEEQSHFWHGSPWVVYINVF